MFFLSGFRPGNGGVLQRPAKDFEEINQAIERQRQQEQFSDKET
jgi:hypothetical protein